MLSDESDEYGEEESDKLGSESRQYNMYGTGLGGLLCGLVFTLGFTLNDDESCDGNRGSLALPCQNIGEACTRACTGACTGDANIFYIAKIFSESWIDPMFVKSAGMGWI